MAIAAASDPLTIQSVWTAAAVVSGFVVTAYMFRIKREAEMRSEGKWYWLTPADHLLILSLGVTLVGVFVLPVLGAGFSVAKYALGWAMLLLAGYPLAAAGHYEILFGHSPEERKLLRDQKQATERARAASRDDPPPSPAQRSTVPPDPNKWRTLPRASHQEQGCIALVGAASVVYWLAVVL